MAEINRNQYVVGPCRITRGTGEAFTKGPAILRLEKSFTPVEVDAFGFVDQRDDDILIKLDFTPEGRVDANTLSFMYPYLNPVVGVDIFGPTADTPTVLLASDGVNNDTHTILCSAVTQMPQLILSAGKTMFGPMEITGVRAATKGWADAASLYTVSTAAAAGSLSSATMTGSELPEAIKIQSWTGVWGALTGFTNIQTEDGWTIDFDLGLQWIKTDKLGTVCAKLKSLKVMAKCVPLGTPSMLVAATDLANSELQLLVQSATGGRGRSSNAAVTTTSHDLTITGADAKTVVVIKSATLVSEGFRFGSEVLRQGEMGWVATRTFATGTVGAIASITYTP
jgi:hypothetical protein